MRRGFVQLELAGNPVIQEHIGEIETLKISWMATGEAEDDALVFQIAGTKGKGRVTVVLDDETNSIRSGTLQMDTGEEYDLLPKGG